MQDINPSTKRVYKLKSLVTTFLITTLPNLVMAADVASKKADDPRQIIAVGAILLVAPLWIYTANKWRLWMWGFEVGYASGGGFKSAFKWTFYSLVASGIVGGIALTIIKSMT